MALEECSRKGRPRNGVGRGRGQEAFKFVQFVIRQKHVLLTTLGGMLAERESLLLKDIDERSF